MTRFSFFAAALATASALPLLLAPPASAQTRDAARSTTAAPRNPGGVSAGTLPANQGKMNDTVGQIDNKLLNEEKTRPSLPGQSPSPSQTQPGGTAAPR
jgi:hypothetical protein